MEERKMSETKVKGTDVVYGYGKIPYTLDELKELCPDSYTKKEIEANPEFKAELARRKKYFSKFYNEQKIPKFNDEIWVEIKGWEKYSVSSKGRIKLTKTNEILTQDDEDGKYGYLVLDKNKPGIDHTTYVYTLVAYAFLDKNKDDGQHVHHIDNNGYNCRPENLILLSKEQHDYVHGFNCGDKYKDAVSSECN